MSQLCYAVDESPPTPLAAGLALQIVVLIITPIVLTPAITLRAAGMAHLIPWTVFAALLICGVSTIVQARPVWRFGSGYVLFMGTSGAFIAISTDALEAGGMPLLGTLVIASALVEFLFSYRLSALRRVITTTVGGTVILLIAVAVMPIAFKLLNETPPGVAAGSIAGPVIAIVAFVVILGISMFASGSLRLWGPLVGIVAGALVAIGWGAFDFTPVYAARWIGLPAMAWPGLDLSFGADFWRLLVPFSIVTVVGGIETYGDSVSIQRLSKRKAEPIDFRSVQGAVYADGLGNVLSGLAGTLPNTTYSTSLSVVDLTGVASRKVAVLGGALLMLIAFSPKIGAILTAVPSAVAGAYIMVLVILLFMHGLRMVTEGGLTYENGMIVSTAFWLAIGVQSQQIFSAYLPAWSRGVLDNGTAAGGIVAIVLSLLVGLRQGRAPRISVPARAGSIATVQDFLRKLAAGAGWDRGAVMRLDLLAEEAILFLIAQPGESDSERSIQVGAQVIGQQIELELVSGASAADLENAAREIDLKAIPTADEIGLRILRGFAASVRHDRFHDVEVLIVTVDSRPL